VYVPVFNADDSPPVVGVFPSNPVQAKSYAFGPSELGSRGMSIRIDSHPVNLGPAYVVGPVTTPPLLDGGGTHFLTIGAFLAPMTPGTHVIRIRGGYFGRGIKATYGFDFIWEDFTYLIHVTR
jgi:hypothetical protein